MWGWKTLERQIASGLTQDEVRETMREEGFLERLVNGDLSIFNRCGTVFTMQGEKMPLEASLSRGERGLLLQLRYNTWVIFDTGDLCRVADRLAVRLAG